MSVGLCQKYMLDKMRECKKCKEILVKVKRVKKNF